MKASHWIIVVISLGQIVAGVACLVSPSIPDAGLFGFTVCTVVGILGLVTQSTGLLRSAAVFANASLTMLFMPAFVSRIIGWLNPSAGLAADITPDLIAAGMVVGSLISARSLWRLTTEPPPSAVPEQAV